MISTYLRNLRRLGPTVITALVLMASSLLGSRHAHAALTGPGPVAFGSLRSSDAALTATTANQNVTITNTGAATVTINATDVVFSNANFSLVSPTLPTTIAAGASRTFVVRFAPSVNGAITGTMTVTDDIPAETVIVDLSGTGTTAVLSTTPATINFGIINVGASSAIQNATMSRLTGATGPLTVSDVSLTGGTASAFQIVSTAGMSCADNQHCTYISSPGLDIAGGKTVGLRCSPALSATTTEITTTFNVVSDSDPTAVDSVAVKCTPGRAAVALDVTSLNFGGVPVASNEVLQVMVSNTGNIALNITITKTGTNTGDFTVPATLTVNAGQTMALNVTFTPGARGARSASVRLATNDLNNAVVQIPVAGTGQAPLISVLPTSVNFGNVIVGNASGAADVVVSNVGEMTLNISSATIVAGTSDFTLTAPTVVGLNNGDALTWNVVCNPIAAAARTGTLRFVSNSATNATFDVPLTCNGQLAAISMTPANSSFANRFVGATDVKTYTITNTGDLALSNITLALAAASTEFTVTTAPASTLAVGASTTAVVRFNPQSAGLKSTTLELNSMQGATALAVRTATVNGQALDFTVTNTGAPLLPTEKRFDNTTANGTLVITNISAVPITISSTAFAPSGMTAAGDFVVNAADAGTVALTAGQTKAVRITLPTVLDRVGATGITGTVTVTASTAGVRTQTFDVAIRSTTAMFALSTDTDFGTFDLDAKRNETKILTITNTAAADAVLDLTSISVLPFAPQPLTGDLTLDPVTLQTTLAPGADQQLIVRFNPTRSQPMAAFDKMIVRVAVKGAFMMPANADFVVQGRAIDRLLQNIATPVFPPTFTYPGELASVRTILVENLGEADLKFNAVLVNASAAWSMDNDGSAVTVPGFSSVPIKLTFSPFDTNKQMATLEIRHNDNTGFENNPMPFYTKSILLEAQGRNRNVVFSTGEIVFDPSPSGVSVLLSDNSNQALATLINQENATSGNVFRISKIEIVGDDAFSVIDGAVDQTIAPTMSAGIDLQFSPPKPGEYRATLKVYFDGAPVATSSVAVVATAVDTKLLGGGGCQSTQHNSTGALLLLAMVGLISRRRWPRHALVSVARTGVLCVSGVAAFGSQVATARADVTQSKNLELSVFRATPSIAPQFLHTESARAGSSGDWSLQVVVSHATDPLIGQVNDGLMRSTALISRRSTFELGAAYSFMSRYEAAVRVPLYVQDGADSSLRGLTGVSGTALGDVSLHLKATAFERSA
ncbi:MAG: choice-of-anchor D domain-containing protein [Kofleriaceae bacterium]|nr:choice-of-anchor D domain-containing protein [Kofleriaceae bacterium]